MSATTVDWIPTAEPPGGEWQDPLPLESELPPGGFLSALKAGEPFEMLLNTFPRC